MTTTAIHNKHRVLILINVRWWNATAFYAINIARLLHQHGHRVWVGCDPTYPAYRIAQTYGLPVAPLAFYGGNPLKLLRSFWALRRLIRSEGIDIINTHRSEDHTFGLLAKWIHRTKLVITRGDQRRIKDHIFSRLRYQQADAVILTCRRLGEDNAHVFGQMENRVHVIHGSVDEERFRPQATPEETAARYEIPLDKTRFGIIGRLSPVKDQTRFVDVAIALAQRRSDLHFLVAGKDVEIAQTDLVRRVRRAGVSGHFTFLSQVDDIADVINLVDIGVITSVTSETISRVLLEFMYLGKPVVATDVNAIGEIVVPGVTGERIPRGNSEALTKAILKLADHPDLCRAYGHNAAAQYGKRYSEARFYRQYLGIFNALTKDTH